MPRKLLSAPQPPSPCGLFCWALSVFAPGSIRLWRCAAPGVPAPPVADRALDGWPATPSLECNLPEELDVLMDRVRIVVCTIRDPASDALGSFAIVPVLPHARAICLQRIVQASSGCRL